MTGARSPLRIIEDGNIIVVRGNAKLLLQDGGFRGPYLGTVRGWALDRERMPDLCAFLDTRRVSYVVTEQGGVLHHEHGGVLHHGGDDQHHRGGGDQQFGLFEDGAA